MATNVILIAKLETLPGVPDCPVQLTLLAVLLAVHAHIDQFDAATVTLVVGEYRVELRFVMFIWVRLLVALTFVASIVKAKVLFVPPLYHVDPLLSFELAVSVYVALTRYIEKMNATTASPSNSIGCLLCSVL